MLLLTKGRGSPKIAHGDLTKYEARILHLLPHQEGGFKQTVCPWSSPGCRASCLNYAGRGQTGQVKDGRYWKTEAWHRNPKMFLMQLTDELRMLANHAYREGRQACARLDGTSDLGLAIEFADKFPSIKFYDYTKSVVRYTQWLLQYPRPSNKWNNRYLTFSRSEKHSTEDLALFLNSGGNVTVVFSTKKGQKLPFSWNGWPVLDGDTHDFRFLDPPGYVVGLRAKGLRARLDKSGFVVQV